MKLWLLDRETAGYDEYGGFVIRAETDWDARHIAASQSADEGEETWLNASFSRCVHLSADGAEEILLASFHAG